VFAYSPELVQAYVVKAQQERADFIATGWRTLSARVRDWLTGGEARTELQPPRVVAQARPEPAASTEPEARRAA
jgi:hypothetical protein